MPGVSSVGAINHLPLAGDLWTLDYAIEGRPVPAPGEELAAVYRVVLPGYFESIGIRRLQGRDPSGQRPRGYAERRGHQPGDGRSPVAG